MDTEKIYRTGSTQEKLLVEVIAQLEANNRLLRALLHRQAQSAQPAQPNKRSWFRRLFGGGRNG